MVKNPPAKPLLVFDGDCGFCRYWMVRWRRHTLGHVDYAPYQDVADQFPEIPIEQFQRAAQLVEPDGNVFAGAEGIFRAARYAPSRRWLNTLYRLVPGLPLAARITYGTIARHRAAAMTVTRLLWGPKPEPSTFHLARWLFLRLLGLIYLIAFLSLGSQVLALIGERGISPAGEFLERVSGRFDAQAYMWVPTLAWLDHSDRFLLFLCHGGALLSGLIVLGFAPGPLFLLLWVFYLSLVSVGNVFLSFQWDALLLETGFLAIFLAPWRWRSRLATDPPPSGWMLVLFRLLLFKLMLLSGIVKLESGDESWWKLTALEYHYWTQPLPLWTAWYVHQLPTWVHRASVAIVFVIELGMPLLFFAPRRPRHLAAGATVFLMLVIGATGNYTFFNLLTIALCVLLLDDNLLRRFTFPRTRGALDNLLSLSRPPRWRALVHAPLFVTVLAVSVLVGVQRAARVRYPEPIANTLRRVSVLHSCNAYGLFAAMTKQRHEIVIQGSDDGREWRPYRLRWKPNDPLVAPCWVQPHQPRVDWQMWFAALSDYRRQPWLTNLMARILEGSPDVLDLFAVNPFSEKPPRYVRAIVYDYHFTTPEEHRETGAWWTRRELGLYTPALSLRGR
ncbi:MAG: lipase maturation factor family protein [Phycisphaerae bacterium]|nr:lipase maturation factor family protein [Phycisphaerae bacterium]